MAMTVAVLWSSGLFNNKAGVDLDVEGHGDFDSCPDPCLDPRPDPCPDPRPDPRPDRMRLPVVHFKR